MLLRLSNPEKEKIKMIVEENSIDVQGARVHNLKNIDIKIPRDQLVVITGLSLSLIHI